MVKKTVKYVDFNGQEQEETLYFHLSKVECTKLEVSKRGGLAEYMKEVVESGDNEEMVNLFEKIILDAYGVKSEDGKRFIKSAELREEFAQSIAFTEIFSEIATNEAIAKDFMERAIQQ